MEQKIGKMQEQVIRVKKGVENLANDKNKEIVSSF